MLPAFCLSLMLTSTAVLNATALAPSVNKPASVPRALAQRDDSVAVFWEKFKAAVIKGDKETVAALSRFPISRGYGIASIRNKAQLMKRYREVFSGETDAAKCFPTAKPLFDNQRPKEFTIGCSFASDGGGDEPFVYSFTLTRSGWKFTGFENINE